MGLKTIYKWNFEPDAVGVASACVASGCEGSECEGSGCEGQVRILVVFEVHYLVKVAFRLPGVCSSRAWMT